MLEYLIIGFLVGVVVTYCYIALTYNGKFQGKPYKRRNSGKYKDV